MANDPDCSLVSVGKPFGEEGYGIGVPKGKIINKKMSFSSFMKKQNKTKNRSIYLGKD